MGFAHAEIIGRQMVNLRKEMRNPIAGKITIVSILGEFLSRILNHSIGLLYCVGDMVM